MIEFVRIIKLALTALLILPLAVSAQMTMVFENDLLSYNRGLELYEKQKYAPAKEQFERAAASVNDQNSEISANANFYVAACALELFHKDSEFLLKEFIRNYSTSPRTKEAWFLLGNYNYRKKNWEEAIDYYDELSIPDLSEPTLSEYLFKKGYSHFQEDELETAADLFFQMKDETSVYYAPGVYYFAHINYEQGNYATALKSFKSLEGHPNFGDVVPYYIVQIYHFQKDYDRLIDYGKPFLENEKVARKAEISRLVGEALYNKQNYAESVPFLEQFMQSNLPKVKEDYYVFGYALYKSTKYELAAEQFSKISYSDDSIGQNAQYHLGESYLRGGKKSYARNAYRSASRLDFDQEIKEDALFKFALLSYELSYDPYDGAIAAFKEYIEAYPDRPRTQEAYDYLVNIYLTSRNYDAALRSIEEYEDPDIRLKDAYQRIAYNNGVNLYQERDFRNAVTYFDKALIYPQNKITTANARYWRAECFYYLGSYREAVKEYEAFIYTPSAVLTPYFNLANYNIGYAFFQQDKFIEAPSWFRRFTSYSKETDSIKLTDANLRIGDCYFMLNQYSAAYEYYNNAVEEGKSDPDYALYQKAMTLGLMKKSKEKLDAMMLLSTSYPNSHYIDAVYYEIGRSNAVLGNEDVALDYLQRVVDEFPGSSYVRKALVSIGQTYYNQQNDDEALKVFLGIIEKFPTYEDTREALIGVQSIYTDRGEVDKYEDLIGSLSFVNLSDLALDSINYESAEIQYFNGQCKEAVSAFTKYLDRFEKGIFALNARYYRAECLSKMGQTKEAMSDFDFVANQPRNKFTESALLMVARRDWSDQNYPQALAAYKRLSLVGSYKENLLEAQIGQMRCNYALNNFQGAIANATIAMESAKLDKNLRTEAALIAAKSNLKLETPDFAQDYLNQVISEGSPSQAAEAMYLKARVQFNQDALDSAESIVFNVVEGYQSESYWLGKSLILLADIYMTRGDLFQAEATLKSVIENYVGDDDVKATAEQKLNTINELESESEESIEELIEIPFSESDSTTIETVPSDTLMNE